MKMRKIFFELPFIEEFEDYHDIIYKRNNLRGLTGDNRIKSKELELGESFFYMGLFYYKGEMPSKEEINFLISKL